MTRSTYHGDDCRVHGSVCAAGEVRALEETAREAAAGSEQSAL